jgi:transcriptional regulator with XRE-family HTH domain
MPQWCIRLRVRRAELDVTQMDVAATAGRALEAGMGLNRYWKIENGQVTPTEDEQAAIADALDSERGVLFAELLAAETSEGAPA